KGDISGKSSSSGKNVKKGKKRDEPIVHFGTNTVEPDVGEFYRLGRGEVESEDGTDREDPHEGESSGGNAEGSGNNGDGGESGAGNGGGQSGNNGSGESGRGNGEYGNNGDGESGAGNSGESDNGSGEGSGNVDTTGQSGDDLGGEVMGGGDGDEESERQEERYKCKFCTHGFDVYDAYLIHVESRHPRWKEKQDEQMAQERREMEVAIAMQQESEDSETVPILDERDESERTLLE
ncbi:MAG: hypothetical protein MJE68_25215, partial [Proteobacteria bacterium]|nr:hypothetical protein [Pseudomonadota bacterium]